MEERLEIAKKRYDEISHRLCDPTVLSNAEEYKRLTKESKSLEPIVEIATQYETTLSALKEAEDLLADKNIDSSLKELATLEIEEKKATLIQLDEQLNAVLSPSSQNEDRNIIMEIRSGTGGEESALFAGSLFRMYSMYAESKGWNIEVISSNDTELGGYKEICFTVSGSGAYQHLRFESGGHRVQRVPETESGGRIHTSAATVAVMPEVEEVEVNIRPEDVTMEVYRASGAGGQKVNKTSSAVRLIHKPSGIVVACQTERSQYQNRDTAMRLLRARLFEAEQQKQQEETASTRKALVGSGDRSDRIRTYNFPQGRVTDHRIGLTLYKIDRIMNGDLDEIITALLEAEQAEKMADSGNVS